MFWRLRMLLDSFVRCKYVVRCKKTKTITKPPSSAVITKLLFLVPWLSVLSRSATIKRKKIYDRRCLQHTSVLIRRKVKEKHWYVWEKILTREGKIKSNDPIVLSTKQYIPSSKWNKGNTTRDDNLSGIITRNIRIEENVLLRKPSLFVVE